jgi:hypothetical protein
MTGSWGFFVAQLMGYVDGVPQHVGDTTATVGRSGGGASAEWGDWSTPGHLFSTRALGIDYQPPYVEG